MELNSSFCVSRDFFEVTVGATWLGGLWEENEMFLLLLLFVNRTSNGQFHRELRTLKCLLKNFVSALYNIHSHELGYKSLPLV